MRKSKQDVNYLEKIFTKKFEYKSEMRFEHWGWNNKIIKINPGVNGKDKQKKRK
jgi:hypothetical protein